MRHYTEGLPVAASMAEAKAFIEGGFELPGLSAVRESGADGDCVVCASPAGAVVVDASNTPARE